MPIKQGILALHPVQMPDHSLHELFMHCWKDVWYSLKEYGSKLQHSEQYYSYKHHTVLIIMKK